MDSRTFILRSESDGLGISVLAVTPSEGRPEAVLQLSHGMCGCKERFLPFMEFMAGNGVACVANDHRGHGGSVISESDLGYMYKGGYKALVEDMSVVTKWIHCRHEGVPVYLLGHSMGSLAARVYAKRHDDMIDGLVVCGSPVLNPFCRPGYVFTGIIERLGAGKWRPSFIPSIVSAIYNRRFRGEGSMAWTCSDPEVRRAFRENPLCNYVFTVNGMHNLLGMMLEAYDDKDWKMSNISMPVIFLSGADDPCMYGERKFHESVADMYRHGYHDISSALYTGMRHEILNETEKEYVWNDILRFIFSCLHTRSRTQ